MMKQRSIEAAYKPEEVVLIKSLDSLKKKLDLIRAEGPSKLVLISDYDDTLTKINYQNELGYNSFRTIENPDVIGPVVGERLTQARNKYIPLESDPTLSIEEKKKHMIDWRRLALDSFIESKLTKQRIKEATIQGKLQFRFGAAELFKILIERKLKMNIVSGGVKGVVTESFELLESQKNFKLDDALIYIMTQDVYNESGVLVKFEEPIIVAGNKDEFVTHELCPQIHVNDNAIVMGDLIEDFRVVKNLKLKTIVTIGFMKDETKYTKEQMNIMMDICDIVVVNDGNLVHANEILRYVLKMEMSPDYSMYANGDMKKLLHM